MLEKIMRQLLRNDGYIKDIESNIPCLTRVNIIYNDGSISHSNISVSIWNQTEQVVHNLEITHDNHYSGPLIIRTHLFSALTVRITDCPDYRTPCY